MSYAEETIDFGYLWTWCLCGCGHFRTLISTDNGLQTSLQPIIAQHHQRAKFICISPVMSVQEKCVEKRYLNGERRTDGQIIVMRKHMVVCYQLAMESIGYRTKRAFVSTTNKTRFYSTLRVLLHLLSILLFWKMVICSGNHSKLLTRYNKNRH